MKTAMFLIAAIVLLAIVIPSSHANEPEPGQRPAHMKRKVTVEVEMKYLLSLPKDYGKEKDKKWPVIMFLHGSGERGDDLNQVKVHGPPKIVEGGKDLPFIIISPQCPADTWWDPQTLIALLDEVLENYSADPDRVYLTGLSMGGFGTWQTAIAYPDRFAAIAPICGGGLPYRAARLRNIPTWVFHGEDDQAVPIQRSEEMVNALKGAGGDVQFTRYPNVGHDSWTATYDNPALYEWFLKHTRKGDQKN